MLSNKDQLFVFTGFHDVWCLPSVAGRDSSRGAAQKQQAGKETLANESIEGPVRLGVVWAEFSCSRLVSILPPNESASSRHSASVFSRSPNRRQRRMLGYVMSHECRELWDFASALSHCDILNPFPLGIHRSLVLQCAASAVRESPHSNSSM